MNPLPEKKHFTAKECADAWGLTVQDLLQYGAYGKIELMVYLELTEGTMYVFRKGKSPREEIKRSAWGGFQILSPMVCRNLQVHPDKPCHVISIEPDQTTKKHYADDDILGIDLFRPFIENGERRYQMITYKDLWIRKEQKQKFEPKKLKQTSTLSKKSRIHPELRYIFWRTFITLKKRNNGINPQYKHVWDAIHDELKDFEENDDIYKAKALDPLELITQINKSNTPNAHLNWYSRADNKSGSYELISLPGLLRDLKKNPPSI